MDKTMNLRKEAYFFVIKIFRGIELGKYYEQYWHEIQAGIPTDTTKRSLESLLVHCQKNVPYYAELMKRLGNSYHNDPIEYISRFPVLTKEIIQNNFDSLKSKDLDSRKWFYMTSGGSTGKPGRVIQDYEYSAKAGAIQLLYSRLVGRETGDLEVYVWGSEKEVNQGKENWKAKISTRLTNSIYFNAFKMPPQRMNEIIDFINKRKPKLIVAYAESIYDLALYIEENKLQIVPQTAIMTSAGTLYPFMRQKLEQVFQCKVYNRYGSREIGNIACERPGYKGLWVAPWANFIEIVNEEQKTVPDGQDGEILITSLINYAMPLIRYKIDDRGSLLPSELQNPASNEQIIADISGRSIATFKTKDGGYVSPGYLMVIISEEKWIKQYQVIQKNFSHIVYKLVLTDLNYPPEKLEEIRRKTRAAFGQECQVDFEFVDEIPPSNSGKYILAINEMKN
jgi:phenylacetate-CoA ligase